MDDREFDEIVTHTEVGNLAEYAPATEESVDLLDILAQDLARQSRNKSLYKSFEYPTDIGTAIFSTEKSDVGIVSSVTVRMQDGESDASHDVFTLVFDEQNCIKICGSVPENAVDAQLVLLLAAADEKVGIREKLMMQRIGKIAISSVSIEEYPGLFIMHNNEVLHTADILVDTVDHHAIVARDICTYTHSPDNIRSTHVSIARELHLDGGPMTEVIEELIATYTDRVLGKEFSYVRDSDGDQSISTKYLMPHGWLTKTHPTDSCMSQRDVDFLTDKLLQRVFSVDPPIQG